MILIDTAARIREAVDDPVLTRQIDESIAELRRDFMKPEFKAILETVGPNGEFIDSIPGRTINPGHSIETAWFILEEAKHRNWDPAAEADRAHDPELVLGMGLGQNTRWNHLF